MNNNPLITFIIVAYNQENYIREAIEGAFSQTYSPLEIVLSDDASTDKTFSIMQEMAAKYQGCHKIILNQNNTNYGITAHLNKICMELSHGEYIVFNAGDDISYPFRVEKCYQVFQQDKERIKIVFSYVDIIDKYGVQQDKSTDIFNRTMSKIFISSLDTLKKNKSYVLQGACIAIHRDIFAKFGKINEDIYAEDNTVCIRAYILGTGYLIKDKLLKYRQISKQTISNQAVNFANYYCSDVMYKQGQSSNVNVLLTIILHQWKNNDNSNVVLARTKYQIAQTLTKWFVLEEFAKSFPKISFKLYCKVLRYDIKVSVKFLLYKLGLFYILRKLCKMR